VAVEQFVDRLTLQRIDRDIFTGRCHAGLGASVRAYGGQIAAQALMAAGSTVEHPQRHVHSLHCYFLRPGRSSDPLTYLVERPRDGRSFSTRIVRAVQQGETIFFMTTSFATVDEGPAHQFTMPTVPPPEATQRIDLNAAPLPAASLPAGTAPLTDVGIALHIDEDLAVPLPLLDGRYERHQWVRITQPVPDDPLAQACALTYLSDLTMAYTSLSPHRDAAGDLQVASIDHAVWFHGPLAVESWLLFTQDTPAAHGGHGLARGLFFDEQGRLVASVVQESLMRSRRPPGAGAIG